MTELRRTAAASIVWALVESGSLSIVAFVVLLVLARLLTPVEFGIAAIAISIVQVVAAVVETLFHDVIVHRDGLTPRHVASAHTVTLVLGVVLTLAVAGMASPIASAFAIPGLSAVLAAASPTILFTAISAVPVALLRRNMDFRTVALRMLIGRTIAGALAVAAAFAGLGLWSLVLQLVATAALASAAVLLMGTAAWPGLAGPAASVGLLRFASTTLAVNLLWGNAVKLFLLMCGFTLSQAAVGHISLAMRIVDTLASIVATAQSKVALSLFSRVFRATGTVREAYLAGSRLSTYMIAPLFAGLALVAHDVVIVTAGDQWLAIVPLVQIFAAGYTIRSLAFLGGATLTATGRPDANVVVSLGDLAAAVLFLIVLIPYGEVGAAAAWVLRLVVTLPLIAFLLSRHAGLAARDLVVGVHGAVIATAVMIAAVLPLGDVLASSELWLRLSLTVAAGAVVYAATIWMIDPKLYALPRQLLADKT